VSSTEHDDADRDDTEHDDTQHDGREHDGPDVAARVGAAHGDLIVRVDVVATAWFTLTAIVAAVVFEGAAVWLGAITALSMFLVGMASFLWAFYNAVQRSRTERVSVTQLFLLLGGTAPPRVRRVMLSMLVIQCVVGLATALARPNSSDGTPGSSLALGVLVPMLGLGLNGLWAAYHGTFATRDEAVSNTPHEDEVRPDVDRIGQNEDHA
jgi:hypothetical protein